SPATSAAAWATTGSCGASAPIWTAAKEGRPMTEKQRQERAGLRTVNQAVPKKDAMQLLLGKPVYTDDITPRDALVVKILRSPHANAIVEEIDATIARKIPGVVAVYTWQDVPQTRFTIAGQTSPEPSPYDRLILDRHVRFAGDAVA